MRTAWIVVEALLVSAFAVGQSALPSPVSCAKTISFAVAEGGQPVPAIPKFAAKWIGKKYHFEGHPDLCLSQIPSSSTANYVVIFSISESSFDGLTPSAHTYTSDGLLSGNVGGVNSYGGTWNYSYAAGFPPGTTSSIDLQKVDASKKVLVVRAYNERGRVVSHYSVDASHSREKLLEQVVTDIHRDMAEPPTHKRVAAPLSVYYVNCDVDSPTPVSMMASTEPPAPAKEPQPKPTPPQATLEFSSDPVGADIYLDGSYIGKSPLTAIVSLGEHDVLIRKSEFGTWQRKLRVTAGLHKMKAYLERKILTVPSGQQ